MTSFYKTITELPAISSLQNSLPLPLATPIIIEGNINHKGLTAELNNRDTLSAELRDKKPTLQFDIGIDEVGRGPLYGSVVVSGAILPCQWSAEIEQNPLRDTPLAILTDSKKLTEAKRERLFEPIKQQALAYMIVEIPASVIDEVNILQATLMGMRLACEQIMIEMVQALQSNLDESLEIEGFLDIDSSLDRDSQSQNHIAFNLLIDGNKVPDLDSQLLQHYNIGPELKHSVNAEAWVRGDARHSAIAAASVLAKVSRDRQLIKDGAAHPGYGLEGHKGYPTKAHIEAIQKLGVLPQHRRSFKPVQEALSLQQL
ncbi:ribonuclease HII [Psychrobacter sanguinis]|uniref:ribonuclease HII n=1 Tax=Psychrobacter sanguinis TaxID=861445 RepID=UPI002A75320E|nr:ribonuclease HII [Psychrobacter sanguinis]MDY3307672.1 ribonuclease HII [Psychrobacter sanguinis]